MSASDLPDHPSMPEFWSVHVNAGERQLVSIGHNWLSSDRALTDEDVQTIIGAARHLLSFVGYGLPPCNFDPDEDEAGDKRAREAVQQAHDGAGGDAPDWRELAARVMDALAENQEHINAECPEHVKCYPSWEAHARWCRWHAEMFRTGKPSGSGSGALAVLAALAAAPQRSAAEPADEEGPAQCSECAGTGRVDCDAKVDNSGRTDSISINCDACEGTGFTPVEQPAAPTPGDKT